MVSGRLKRTRARISYSALNALRKLFRKAMSCVLGIKRGSLAVCGRCMLARSRGKVHSMSTYIGKYMYVSVVERKRKV